MKHTAAVWCTSLWSPIEAAKGQKRLNCSFKPHVFSCVQGWESHQDLSVAPPPSRRTLPGSVSQNLNPQTGTPDETFISWWILSLSLFYLYIFTTWCHELCFYVVSGRLHLHPSFSLFSFPPASKNESSPTFLSFPPSLFSLVAPPLLLSVSSSSTSVHSGFAASYLPPVKAVPQLLKSLLPGGKEDSKDQTAVHQQVRSLSRLAASLGSKLVFCFLSYQGFKSFMCIAAAWI